MDGTSSALQHSLYKTHCPDCDRNDDYDENEDDCVVDADADDDNEAGDN